MTTNSMQAPAVPIVADPNDLDEFAPEMGMLASVREAPAWAISLGVHVLVLMGLWSITRITLPDQQTLIDSVWEEVDEETFKFDSAVQTDQIGSDSDVNMQGPSMASSHNVSPDPQKEIEEKLQEELLEVSIPLNDAMPQPAEADLAKAFDTTGDTQYPGGTEGAMDRLAFEITNSLRDNKTLVIWLFDASQSLTKRRDTIADRFENVYAQVSKLNSDSDRALKTAVATFGERTQIITPEPIDDVAPVVEAIRNIAPDTSGKEHVFTAVKTVANKWLTYRTRMRRNIMIVIVTDERGDDYAMVEDVAAHLAHYGIRVYCVGNASPFGREVGYHTWEYDDGVKVDLPVDQGPESVKPDRMELTFWGGNRNNREYDRLTAGYGPYALTRLCAETGGVFFVANEGGPVFDPAIMRDYQPDYRPIRDYIKDVQKNPAKAALVAVCEQSRVANFRPPQLVFDGYNDTVLRTVLDAAQRPIAEFDYALAQPLAVLSQTEKAREKIKEPRWRAAYDLAIGRLYAMRVRAFGYNKMLAEMKSQPLEFKKKGSNSWQLVPSRTVDAGPDVRKLEKKANLYLKRVIDEHSGTPWATLAEREITQPMGWKWVELTRNIPGLVTRRGPDGEEMLVLDLAEAERQMRQRRPAKQKKRQPPSL